VPACPPPASSDPSRPDRVAVIGALLFVTATVAAPPGCYPPPVAAAIAEPFSAPACNWCPGNRGVDYLVQPGTPVTALADGTVSFAGSVAGVRWVVVAHDDGLRSSYGPMAGITVARDQHVTARQILGTSQAQLHLGLRRGDDYLDPAPYLAQWIGRPRLVPTDGTPARPAPPAVLRCATGPIGR